ncbi:MAG: tetratricopeptide repeat protein [Lysobacter sp.]|nr:tetratricopeptide repeat protein [Lysobacter sp.]
MQERIFAALRRGANAEALTLARVAVAEAPHDAHAYALLAHAERANGDQAAAQHAIARAVLLAPEDANLHFQRAGFLLNEHKLGEAQAALTRTLDLDPNQFPAYILQAQMAIGRGEIDEAERLQRSAARLSPDHAWVKTLEGMIALRRGDGARAQTLLIRAAEQMPNDLQVLYALGFAHLNQRQFAFAEQAFRKIIDLSPAMQGLRGLLADVLLQQQRPDEALEALQPLLDNPATATPALKRMTAELEMTMGRQESAIQRLREALAEDPRDPRAWSLATDIWRRTGDVADARTTLDIALERHPEAVRLWQLRLAFEPEGGDGAKAVVDRWLAATPEHVLALEAAMHLHEARGDTEAVDALAQRIIEVEPGRTSAEMRVLDRMIRDQPEAAIVHIEGLIAKAGDDEAKRGVMPWLGYAQDRAGRHAEAVATWIALNAGEAAARWPLTSPGPAGPVGGIWPDAATAVPGTPPVAYLWGLPGSGVEKVAAVIGHAGYPLCADRFAPNPPQDPMQNPDTIAALNDGRLTPERLLAEWHAALPARGIRDGIVIDWLPFWDNAFLKMLRPLQPGAIVMVALRDPRDMLLEWLAFGSTLPYGIASPTDAALWMARQLQHVVALRKDNLQPHKIVATDHALTNVEAFAAEVGGGLGLEEIRVPPDVALGTQRFAFGHWRHYAKPLAEPFALLSQVAQTLGYPER